MNIQIIEIFTDGSCNPEFLIGGWAASIFHNDKKIVIQGTEFQTTHNRMELMAVIQSVEYVLKEFQDIKSIKIFTDSQYVAEIPRRKEKLITKNLKTKRGNSIHNVDLIEKLIDILNSTNIEFIKVKAHQKSSEKTNYNREVDKLSRKIVRQKVVEKFKSK